MPGILLLNIGGFPNLIAAQATVGITGIVGGLSYAWVFGAMTRKLSVRQTLSLSASWAISLFCGVSTTFLVSGSSIKMMILTFFSFAVWGMVGAFVTVRIWRCLVGKNNGKDVPPEIFIWSLTLGIAAVASELIGEAMKSFLPAWLAWAISYEAMAVIIGCGGGWAVIRISRSGRTVERLRGGDMPAAAVVDEKVGIPFLLLLCLPFYLNDFANIYIRDWRLWLSIDYIGVKLFPLLLIGWLIRRRKITVAGLGLIWTPAVTFCGVFLVGTLVGIFLEHVGYAIMDGLPGYRSLGTMPEIVSPFWSRIDLTAGLMLVALIEELIFRGLLAVFLSRYTESAAVIVGISASAFGMIHWSGGMHQVLLSGAAGAVFMALYLRTRSLPPLILSHFVIDFVSFADIVPKSMLRFF
ncbi:MAG: CPBP family intramembrane metalloprotease [Pseudomonadota bacterium]|nr:CPBP family intramembrane metalloprotease [Pseudomonadota bacterium]